MKKISYLALDVSRSCVRSAVIPYYHVQCLLPAWALLMLLSRTFSLSRSPRTVISGNISRNSRVTAILRGQMMVREDPNDSQPIGNILVLSCSACTSLWSVDKGTFECSQTTEHKYVKGNVISALPTKRQYYICYVQDEVKMDCGSPTGPLWTCYAGLIETFCDVGKRCVI